MGCYIGGCGFYVRACYCSKTRVVVKLKNEIHYKDVECWPWIYFLPKEIACKGTGKLLVDPMSMSKLDVFREIIGVSFTPNSAYRSEEHNKNVGGAPNSYHRKGQAFDIPIKKGMSREDIHRVAKQVGFTGFGDYNSFVHIDTGRARYWDKRT